LLFKRFILVVDTDFWVKEELKKLSYGSGPPVVEANYHLQHVATSRIKLPPTLTLIAKTHLEIVCLDSIPYFCFVRLINILFSVYVAFLVCYPCTDEASQLDVDSYSAKIASRHTDAGEEDPCSPLCVCRCCSSQIHQPTHFSFSAFCPVYTETNDVIETSLIPSVSYSIWQPPKQS
jgi:hypothetical protein